MSKEFLNYEQSLALKELGFDESCMASRDMNNDKGLIQIPLYQQAFRWFREKHNLLGGVYSNASGWAWKIHDNVGGTHRFSSEYTGDCLESGMFTSFEKAELDCIKYLIEIVKNK
jgi:hypothetical protein